MTMLFVSSRKQLTNEDEIGPTTYWEFDIDGQVADDDDRHEISLPALLNRVAGKSVLVLVHGYNNELEDIVRAYDMIRELVGQHLNDWYDEVIGFTWPGGDSPIDWYPPKRRAGVIAPRFARFVDALAPRVAAVDLMSHSLGARVVLGALNRLRANTVRANFLTASAVDNETIETGEKFFPAVLNAATESIVFHSKLDWVLRSAYRLAEWDNPLGLFGPENPGIVMDDLPNVYVANCKNVINSHGEYKSESSIYRFIDRWLNGQVTSQFVTL